MHGMMGAAILIGRHAARRQPDQRVNPALAMRQFFFEHRFHIDRMRDFKALLQRFVVLVHEMPKADTRALRQRAFQDLQGGVADYRDPTMDVESKLRKTVGLRKTSAHLVLDSIRIDEVDEEVQP